MEGTNGLIKCLVSFERFNVCARGAAVESLGFGRCEDVGGKGEDPCCGDLEVLVSDLELWVGIG